MNATVYWRRNVAIVIGCLVVWAGVSYFAGIIFAEDLNKIRLGGFKLGFWFAQQGSVLAFVVLTFFYAWQMSRLDDRYQQSRKDRGELAE